MPCCDDDDDDDGDDDDDDDIVEQSKQTDCVVSHLAAELHSVSGHFLAAIIPRRIHFQYHHVR